MSRDLLALLNCIKLKIIPKNSNHPDISTLTLVTWQQHRKYSSNGLFVLVCMGAMSRWTDTGIYRDGWKKLHDRGTLWKCGITHIHHHHHHYSETVIFWLLCREAVWDFNELAQGSSPFVPRVWTTDSSSQVAEISNQISWTPQMGS